MPTLTEIPDDVSTATVDFDEVQKTLILTQELQGRNLSVHVKFPMQTKKEMVPTTDTENLQRVSEMINGVINSRRGKVEQLLDEQRIDLLWELEPRGRKTFSYTSEQRYSDMSVLLRAILDASKNRIPLVEERMYSMNKKPTCMTNDAFLLLCTAAFDEALENVVSQATKV